MTIAERIRTWRRGVWSNGENSLTIWTDSYYFVISVDSAGENIYCGAAEVRYTDDGIETRQTLRVRRPPGGELFTFAETDKQKAQTILHRVAEVGEDFILFDSCAGDRFRLQADGVDVYMPAFGNNVTWRRIESF
ncbi:hypothetical protein H8E77_23060 [bacterium]|nr:hypothetical protein [bacterium]